MDTKEILSIVDHTQLAPTATWVQIQTLCDEAIEAGCASVCIPPSYVERVKDYVQSKMKICTVIGFPNGYNTTATKLFESKEAIEKGADELDVVIRIGALKAGKPSRVRYDLETMRETCPDQIIKVIVETCLLTEDEKKIMCELVTETGMDFIKTSTGFSTGGATVEDIALFKQHIGPDVKIKAAGGIGDFDQAIALINAGADRLGSSRLVRLAKEM